MSKSTEQEMYLLCMSKIFRTFVAKFKKTNYGFDDGYDRKPPMALNQLGRVIQRLGFLPRKSNGKQGYVVYVNQDLDNQRKLDARSARDTTG